MPSGLHKPTRGCRSKQRTVWLSPRVMRAPPRNPWKTHPNGSKCYFNILLLSNPENLSYLCLPQPWGQRRPGREAKESIFKPRLSSRGCAEGRRSRQTARRATLRAKVVGPPSDSLEPEDYLTNSCGMVVTIAIAADKSEQNQCQTVWCPQEQLRQSGLKVCTHWV